MNVDTVLELYKSWSKRTDIEVSDISGFSISAPMDSKSVYDLYNTRYSRYLANTGERNTAYENLLSNLLTKEKVLLSCLESNEDVYLVVSDVKLSEVLGVLGGKKIT